MENNHLHVSATFVKSCPSIKEAPEVKFPEYAFIGRSNVGKSSLINALVQQKKLAKTSSTPGKTQLINYFLVDESWYLVDLPGYGYAKTPKKVRQSFVKMIDTFLLNRMPLMNTFVLIDSRHKPQEIDLQFIENLAIHQIPFSLVFTKTDKLKPKELEQNIEHYKKELLIQWEELPEMFITSAKNNEGRVELFEKIMNTNHLFHAYFNK